MPPAASFECETGGFVLGALLPGGEDLQQIPFADEDFRLLALARASAVRDHLVEKGPVEADRLFVIEPKIPASEEDKARNLGEAKVDLIIK